MSSREFMMAHDIRPIIIPVDLATADNTGIFQPVRNYARVAFVYFADPGTASQDVTLTLRQATDTSGTGAKNLSAVKKAYVKEHVSTLPSDFTEVTQAAAATYVSTTGGESIELEVIEVDPADMDVANGFDCISLNIADPGATAGKIGCVLMIGQRARYADTRPSAAA